MPEFLLFSGEASLTTIEDIARFTVQCGEAGADDLFEVEVVCQLLA